MKRLGRFLCVVVAWTAFCANAAHTNAIERLFNAQASGSLRAFEQAAEEVAERARQGHPVYAYVLALASRMPSPPPAARLDEATRNKYLDAVRDGLTRSANEKKNSMAMFLLSLEGGDLDCLCRAADMGNIQAMNAWGDYLVKCAGEAADTNEVNRLLGKAIGYFKNAAEKGNENGFYNLGLCHLRGLGMSQDDKLAFDHFFKSAEMGHPGAINQVGLFYREGRVVAKNLETSAQWFEKSADLENPLGQFYLARALQNGEGVARDEARAAVLLEKSAAGGCVEAIVARNTAKAAPPPKQAAPSPEKATPSPEKATPSPEKATPSPEKATPPPEKATPPPKKATPPPEKAATPPPVRVVIPANADPMEAITRLFNARASGSVREFAQAAEEVAEMARQGRPFCPYVIAIVSRMSFPPPAARLDEETRNKYLADWRDQIKKLADEKNDPMALYLLSLEGNDRNFLHRAAEAGNVQAMNVWGTYLITHRARAASDTNEVNRILGEAYEYFKNAADRDDANGLYNLGMCYMQGLGVSQDDQNAFGRFSAAAKKGHPEAMNNIALFYREGRVVEKNLEMSAKHFGESASYDNPYGQFNYALALQNGEGVEKDEARAAALLSKSADGGCIEAIDAYGMALLNGRGVPENAEEAFRYFLRAADAGYPPAMENLSTCYKYGKGVKADGRRSMEWKIRSRAARGDRNAQAWLQQNAKRK